MAHYNFKSYQMRAANAATEVEKANINKELKDLYASLDETEKKVFNTKLDIFLKTESERLKNDYEAIKKQME